MRQIIIFVLSLLFFGCNYSTEDVNNSSSLLSTFVIKDKFGQEVNSFLIGEEITLEIIVQNTTNTDITYQATGSGYGFEVKQGQTEVWSSANGISVAQVITDRIINSFETLVLSSIWTGIDNNGTPVSLGDYEISPNLVFFTGGSLVQVPASKIITIN